MPENDQQQDATDFVQELKNRLNARTRAERIKRDADRENQSKSEQAKAETQRKAEAAKETERRIAESRRRDEGLRMDRKRDELRKEFEQRRQGNAKASAEKETRQRQSASQAEERKQAIGASAGEDQRQAFVAEIRRRAEAAVAERQRREKAHQLEEHRRQTDHMRTLHRGETHSYRENEAAAVLRHAHEIRSIDEGEERSLQALGARRSSLRGRVTSLVKGNAHYDRQAEAITSRSEAERMGRHRDLESLKERQFAVAQEARLRHARERKGIFELHRVERQQLGQAQNRDRASMVGMSQRAFERSAQRKEETSERSRDRGRELSR